MENKRNQNGNIGVYPDWSFFIRELKKWKFVFAGLMVIVGVFSYIIMDLRLQETYSVSAIVSVVSKQGSEYSLSDSNINGAINRNIAMWQSNTLRKIIQNNHPDHPISGNLYARNLDNTALIELSARADNAEDAYYLLNEALKHSHEIEANFDKNYVAKVMVGIDANRISHYRSNTLKYHVIAVTFVMIGCLALLGFWCLVTTVIHSDKQAYQLVDAPILESVPKLKKKYKSILITQPDNNPDYVRSIERLAVRVERELHRKGEKVVLVTSIRENEGKSTITSNLALVLARRGNRTLLIDADLKRPALYKIFDHEKRTGHSFSDLLQKKVEFEEVFEKCNDMYVIWQYTTVRDSDRLLESTDMETVLNAITPYYDVILLDTPPMGPVRDTDVIADSATNALLVVRQDYTRAGEINDAIDTLEEHGNRCLGIIMNNCQGMDWGMTRIGRMYHKKYVKK